MDKKTGVARNEKKGGANKRKTNRKERGGEKKCVRERKKMAVNKCSLHLAWIKFDSQNVSWRSNLIRAADVVC